MTLSLNQHPNASPSPTSLSPPTSPVVSSPSPSTLTSHFVQALHDYLPSSVTSTDDSVCCLFFKKGSIIEVFNRDDSGWWDGQCGDVRGWFPSNYVGRIGELKRSSADFEDDYSSQELELWHQRLNHHVNSTSTVSLEEYSTKVSTIQTRVEMARALLREDRRKSSSITTSKPSTSSSQLQILVQDVSKRVAELVDACNQPASSNIQLIIFQVVSAVRSVLTEANIVNKESALLRMYPELARQRKIVLSALSRLVLKGKELQQDADSEQPLPPPPAAAAAEDEHDQASYFADQLLNEMEMFEKLLMVIPRQSSVSDSTVDTTRPSSMFHFDTPRSSVSSLGHSSVISTTSLRHISTSTDPRHTFTQSTASLIAKAVPISDKEHILHNILDHQASIDELMASLVMTLERYLVNRHRATEMLETTRKAVEAVRTFLAVVEHVCSNLGDLDYNRRISMIPEDPCLVTLVITKESVYSAITNLVTAVRVLTGPQKQEQHQQDENIIKEDFDHLCLCCEDVVKTTNECAACVRACLQAEQEEQEEHDKIMYTMQEDTKSDTIAAAAAAAEVAANNLSVLGRKISSLHAIQHYHQDQHEQADSCEKLGDEGHSEQDIEGLAIESAPKISTNTENNALKSMCNGHDVRTHAMISSRNSPMPAASTSSSSSSINAATTTTTTSSSEAGPASAVDAIVPETIPQRQNKLRPRAASVNNSQFLPLPPLPPKNSIIVKPSVSAAAFPLPPAVNTPQQQQQHDASVKGAQPKDQVLKSRRPRGLSVSSLRPSINKSKSERITNTASSLSTSSSMESLLEPLRLQKLPSWMSISSNAVDKHEHHNANSMDIAPSPQLQLPKKEPEHDFLKQYVFTEDEMMFNADGEVTGATIEALVQKLTLHEKSPDLLFTRAFFYNFRLFTNPADFVQLLKDRFTLKPPTEPAPLPDDQLTLWTNRVLIPIRLRVYNVIKTWLETYFSFEQDASVEQSLVDFASHEMSKAMPGPAKRMLELITRTFASKGLSCAGRKHSYNETRITMQKSYSTSLQSSTISSSTGNIFSNLTLFDDHHHVDSSPSTDKYPQSILGKSLRNTLKKALSQNSLTVVHVQDFDPTELARQLTIMENSLFCRIRPNEMIGQEFKKKVGTSQAIHVKAMIQRSTQITSWVSDTILNETDTKKRAHVLKYWIKVGDACLQLNNYNTLMAIRSALDSTSIARLRKTWEYISLKYKAMWDPIYRATDSQRNFAEYRQRLKTTIAPCLPFLGVYLTDMTFIDDGNADHRMSPGGKQLINFDKYVKITRILNEIDQFQISYKLFEVDEIQKFLKQTLESVEQDDQVFYAKSLKREPKEEDLAGADKQ